MNRDDHISKLRDVFRQKRLLLKSERFEELESFLDDIYGTDTDQRHAEACDVLWERGERDKALENAVARLMAGNYTISHVFMDARFAHDMHRIDIADFLYNRTTLKNDEESSKKLIEYVFKKLNNIHVDHDLEINAKLFL